MATLIFVLAAFVVDYGVAFTNKRHLQDGADAAALAGARTVQVKATLTDTCGVITGGSIAGDASAAAMANVDANGAQGDAAGGQSFSLTCEDDRPVAEVDLGRHNSTRFATAFGVDEIAVSGVARATVGPAGSAIGLRPFGICEDIADEIAANPTTNKTVPIDNADLGCGMASGNWAMLDMNGGSNSTAEAKAWIEHGFEDEVGVETDDGTLIEGDTGTPSPGGFEAAMNSILGTETVLPVFSEIQNPSGANADFVVTSFIGVRVCGWKFNGQSGSTGCFVSSGSLPKSYIQIRFARVIAVGELSSWCRLGDSSCDRGVRVIKLVD